jgi:hypothetical protein
VCNSPDQAAYYQTLSNKVEALSVTHDLVSLAKKGTSFFKFKNAMNQLLVSLVLLCLHHVWNIYPDTAVRTPVFHCFQGKNFKKSCLVM